MHYRPCVIGIELMTALPYNHMAKFFFSCVLIAFLYDIKALLYARQREDGIILAA